MSAALAFRLVNFWLAIAVGWVTVALIAQFGRRRMPGCAVGGAVLPSDADQPGGLSSAEPASVPPSD